MPPFKKWFLDSYLFCKTFLFHPFGAWSRGVIPLSGGFRLRSLSYGETSKNPRLFYFVPFGTRSKSFFCKAACSVIGGSFVVVHGFGQKPEAMPPTLLPYQQSCISILSNFFHKLLYKRPDRVEGEAGQINLIRPEEQHLFDIVERFETGKVSHAADKRHIQS